ISVEVLRYDKKEKREKLGRVPTEMKLILEHTQQGISYEVSVSTEGVEELKRNDKMEILLESTSNKLMVGIRRALVMLEILSRRFFLKLNLSDHRYVGPFNVLERVGDVAYKLDLTEELSRVHNTFHVSNLKKCHADEPLAVPLYGLHVDDKLHFVEEPVEIMDHVVDKEANASGEVNFASIATTDRAAATMTVDEVTLAQALVEIKKVILKLRVELQAKFDKEHRLASKKAQQVKEANIDLIETWDDVQAKINVDYQLDERLQAEEQQELNDAEKATLFMQLLDKRRKFFVAKRVEEKRNKRPTRESSKKAEAKVKEGSSKRVGTKLEQESSKRAGTKLEQENSKKQKIDDDK
nr:putative reverse transcriptase domain-containing protein [Tanacetum cinerariifolium]